MAKQKEKQISYTVIVQNLSGKIILNYNRVVQDGMIDNKLIRYFVTDEGLRFEVPMENTCVIFSKERTGLLNKRLKEIEEKTNVWYRSKKRNW